jgi:hypothetical protein
MAVRADKRTRVSPDHISYFQWADTSACELSLLGRVVGHTRARSALVDGRDGEDSLMY